MNISALLCVKMAHTDGFCFRAMEENYGREAPCSRPVSAARKRVHRRDGGWEASTRAFFLCILRAGSRILYYALCMQWLFALCLKTLH